MESKSKGEVLIFTGSFDETLSRPFVTGGIKAGFPSPAQDYLGDTLDFNKDLISHPEATFYGRVKGDSMIEAGLEEGDILVIDRAAEVENGDIVVAFVDGEFAVKYYDDSHFAEGYIMLRPANKNYQPIRVDASKEFIVWGVVIWTIKKRV